MTRGGHRGDVTRTFLAPSRLFAYVGVLPDKLRECISFSKWLPNSGNTIEILTECLIASNLLDSFVSRMRTWAVITVQVMVSAKRLLCARLKFHVQILSSARFPWTAPATVYCAYVMKQRSSFWIPEKGWFLQIKIYERAVSPLRTGGCCESTEEKHQRLSAPSGLQRPK